MRTVQERFDSKVERIPEGGCHVWMGGLLASGGYGVFMANKVSHRAHRFSWIQANGEIPKGMFILHSCDNPCCVNPDHLSVGTHQDNMDDMVKKGRQNPARGTKHSSHKLTEKQVRAIRASSVSSRKLGAEYGVSKTLINHIKTKSKKGWGWLE